MGNIIVFENRTRLSQFNDALFELIHKNLTMISFKVREKSVLYHNKFAKMLNETLKANVNKSNLTPDHCKRFL